VPAAEPQGSIFPDPFGEEEAGEPAVQAPPEAPHSISHSDIADDSVVDCMRESEYRAEAQPASGGPDHGLAFDLEDESEEESSGVAALVAERSNEELPEEVPVGSGPRTVISETSEPVRASQPATIAAAHPAGESTCPAHVVASALETIVSDLVASVLQNVTSGESVRSADPTCLASGPSSSDFAGSAPRTVASNPGDDDHSYQWHAFQDDGDATLVEPWGEEAPGAVAVTAEPAAAVDSASREAASGKSGKPIASDPQSHHVVPNNSADAPDGMLDYESSADPENADNLVPAGATRGGGWTIPVLCAGISIIACCLLIPLCDANRRAAYEKLRLRRDLESLQHQVATNDEFLRKVSDDPTLAERLAQRQLRKVRAGMHDVPLNDDAGLGRSKAAFGSMSPFGIVAVPPPPPLAPYHPVGGRIATLCYNPHTRLYLTGVGLMFLAMGLVMGYGPIGILNRRESCGVAGE
jgi:hypothetical protein